MTRVAVKPLRVLRIAHHGVVAPWRQRERELRNLHADITLVSAECWNEGGVEVPLEPGTDDFVVGVRTFGKHPNAFIYAPGLLWRLLSRHWDLIDLHEEPFSLATAEVLAMRKLRGLRTPFVLYSAQNIAKRYPVPFRWLERYALRHAAGAYVCNADAGEILQKKGLRSIVRLIGLGADLNLFTQEPRSGPRVPLRVGYVGRLETHKGVHVLLRAVAEMPACVLELAGDGSQRAELGGLVAELGIADRVTFRGHLADRLPEFYRGLDVLVVPSLPTPGWLEQFGRVVIEAMASGVPVIASRSGALPDVVDGAGILVDPGSVDGLRDAMAEVAEPTRWAELREAGMQHCLRYSWRSIARTQREFYDDVLEPASRGTDSQAPPEVVVVAYGPAGPLEEAIRELVGLSITIVDNSSSAATRDVAERHQSYYIDPGGNIGFAAGVNRALESLAERGLNDSDVLLLNPDATVSLESIGILQQGLHRSPTHACVAPVQRHPVSGLPERVSWPFPSPGAAWMDALGLGRLDRRAGFVIGSVLLLRASAIADVGRFDERFFLYAEETDWQLRAVRRGWTTSTIHEATATHIGAGTGGDSTRRAEMFNSSLLAFMDKHYGRLGELSYRSAVMLGAAVRSLVGRGASRHRARWRLGFYARAPRPRGGKGR